MGGPKNGKMRIGFVDDAGRVVSLDLDPAAPVASHVATIASAFSMPAAALTLSANGRALLEGSASASAAGGPSFASLGINSDNLVLVGGHSHTQPRTATRRGGPGGLSLIPPGLIPPRGAGGVSSSGAGLRDFFASLGAGGGGAGGGGGGLRRGPPVIAPEVFSSLSFDTLPLGYTPEQLHAILRVNERMMREAAGDADFEAAARQPTPAALRTLLLTRQLDRAMPEAQRSAALAALDARLEANPMDAEAQRLLLDEINRKNVEANHDLAFEHMPEAFGTVDMLYVHAAVNKVPLKCFVDSGAQMTIMSRHCAERCNIMRLVDVRYAGTARGVGSAKILGRVHVAELVLAGTSFPCTFNVLEQDDMEFLLGLDMLKRYQAAIDLYGKKLVLRVEGRLVETPFLEGFDLPKGHLGGDGAKEGGAGAMDEVAADGSGASGVGGSTSSSSFTSSSSVAIDVDVDDASAAGRGGAGGGARVGAGGAGSAGGAGGAGGGAAVGGAVASAGESVGAGAGAGAGAGSSLSGLRFDFSALAAAPPPLPPSDNERALMAMGFSQRKVAEALVLSAGDVGVAAQLLPDL